MVGPTSLSRQGNDSQIFTRWSQYDILILMTHSRRSWRKYIRQKHCSCYKLKHQTLYTIRWNHWPQRRSETQDHQDVKANDRIQARYDFDYTPDTYAAGEIRKRRFEPKRRTSYKPQQLRSLESNRCPRTLGRYRLGEKATTLCSARASAVVKQRLYPRTLWDIFHPK